MGKRGWLMRGMRDGMPIAVGYFAVAFALGIAATNAQLTPYQAALLSLFNVTSAGEAAGITLLGLGTTYAELAMTQLVINARYLLMSCSLSQKILPETSLLHRALMAFGVTDEIFGIASAAEKPLSPYYNYGAMAVAIPGWTLGTLLGAVAGGILPVRAVSALSVALYGMFIAIILPPAKQSRIIAGLVAVSMAASGGLYLLAERLQWTALGDGYRIIILTVVIAGAAALLFPIPPETGEKNGGDAA